MGGEGGALINVLTHGVVYGVGMCSLRVHSVSIHCHRVYMEPCADTGVCGVIWGNNVLSIWSYGVRMCSDLFVTVLPVGSLALTRAISRLKNTFVWAFV
jgi:hypothetical protein